MRVKEWEDDVIFLHEVVEGASDRSYSLAVVKLAGLPPSVLARAKTLLAELEAGTGGGPPAGAGIGPGPAAVRARCAAGTGRV